MAAVLRKAGPILGSKWCGIVPSSVTLPQSYRQDRTVVTRPKVAHYGGRHTVTLIPGDGVHPEILMHIKEVFRYAGAPVDFEEVLLNETNLTDAAAMEHALLAVKRNGVALKGNIETPLDLLQPSVNVQLRTKLDLFANVLWCKTIPGVHTRHDDVDIVVIRENTEGEYASLEHENVPGVVESLKIITREKSRRIAEFAFEFAEKFERKRVTAIHKANIMKLGDGLFLQSCADVAKNFPDIEFNDMIIDNCSMQLVSRPSQFDVMVMPNLYGNIVGNICAGLVGGPGVVSGMNIGTEYAIFETGTRNSGRSIAGLNIANPVALLLGSADMLQYLGLLDHAHMIRSSTLMAVVQDNVRTPDLGGQATTTEVVHAVIKNIQRQSDAWPKNRELED